MGKFRPKVVKEAKRGPGRGEIMAEGGEGSEEGEEGAGARGRVWLGTVGPGGGTASTYT